VVVLAAYAAYQLLDPRGTGWAECLVLGLAVPFFREVQVPIVRRVAAAIAKYSYGIYLFHLIAIYYCFDSMTGPTSMRVAGSLIFTAVAAVVSYHLLEEPLIEYGRRLGHTLAPPQAKKTVAQAVGT
jgi:peptidoglycan/LPS O-acetylase OafA/YrhL